MGEEVLDFYGVKKKFSVGSWWVTPGDRLSKPKVGKVVFVHEVDKKSIVKLETMDGMEDWPYEFLRRAELREIMKFHFDESMRKLNHGGEKK